MLLECKKRGVRCLLAAAVVGGTLAAVAQAAPLSLMSAYEMALSQDPKYRVAVEEAVAGEQYRALGRSYLLPQVQLTYNMARNHSEITRTNRQIGERTDTEQYRSYSAAMQLRQPLFNWDYWSRYRQGEAQSQASAATFDSRTQEVALRVASAFTEVLQAYDQIALVEAQQAALAEQLRLNQRFFDKGEGTRTDIIETQARYELVTAQVLEAKDELTVVRKRLEGMIGTSLDAYDAPMSLLSEHYRAAGPQPADLNYWIDVATSNNRELQSKYYAVEVARQDIERARSGHLPKVDVVASFGSNKSETVNTLDTKYETAYIGLQMVLPIYSGGAVSAQMAQSEANYRKAVAEYDGRRIEILDELRKQFDLGTSSVAKVAAYERAAQSATELIRSTRKSIAGGMRVNLDLLNAQQQLYVAQRDLAQARYTAIVTRLRLLFVSGVLTEQDVRETSAWFSSAPVATTR